MLTTGVLSSGIQQSTSIEVIAKQKLLLNCTGNAEKARSNSSYASAAMVQAALNAMASSASADPMEASSTSLTPTTPLAAAVILQVCYYCSLVLLCLSPAPCLLC